MISKTDKLHCAFKFPHNHRGIPYGKILIFQPKYNIIFETSRFEYTLLGDVWLFKIQGDYRLEKF